MYVTSSSQMPVASVPDTTLPMEIWYTQKLKRPKATKKKFLLIFSIQIHKQTRY